MGPVCAIASDIVRDEYGGVDEHVNFYLYVKTQRDKQTGDILWGGIDPRTGDLRGPTRIYLGAQMISGPLKGCVAMGGGPIACEEVVYARNQRIPILYIPSKAKNGQLGPVDRLSLCRN